MRIQGIGASPGIAIESVYKMDDVVWDIPRQTITDIKNEQQRFQAAIAKTVDELSTIRTETKQLLDEQHATIFDAHIHIASDPEIKERVLQSIETDHVSAPYAYYTVSENYILMFQNMNNEYLKERALDVKDVRRRMMAHLLGSQVPSLDHLTKDVILLAKDITPSLLIQLDKEHIKGIITSIGGKTSHSAILARSMDIPSVVGATDAFDKIRHNEQVIVDGFKGVILTEPTGEEFNEYEEKCKKYQEEVHIWAQYIDQPSISKDGKQIRVVANIGNLWDVESALKRGAEGIGLYRTEFLFMNRESMPNEDIQFHAYKQVLEAFPNQKVLIRTLDIGGDKPLPYLPKNMELNPFMGERALRLSLRYPDMFKTQLRALLRASIYGNLYITLPMVATLDEVLETKELIRSCKEELTTENIPYSNTIKLGIMMEIPSAALHPEEFIDVVDYFSIGTNDLIQYLFAADRLNPKVSYLYQPYHPILLQTINHIIEVAHNQGKWVGMCGEMASDPIAIPILLGLGLDEFSMSPSSILRTRHIVRQLDYVNMEKMAKKCLKLTSNAEIKAFVENSLKENDNHGKRI